MRHSWSIHSLNRHLVFITTVPNKYFPFFSHQQKCLSFLVKSQSDLKAHDSDNEVKQTVCAFRKASRVHGVIWLTGKLKPSRFILSIKPRLAWGKGQEPPACFCGERRRPADAPLEEYSFCLLLSLNCSILCFSLMSSCQVHFPEHYCPCWNRRFM